MQHDLKLNILGCGSATPSRRHLPACQVLEHNGQISFLPRAQDRPLTPADMHLAPEQEYLPTVVVMDGQALAGNLKSAGKDEKWLLEQLDRQGYRTPKAVFLATLDKDMNLTAYPCAR